MILWQIYGQTCFHVARLCAYCGWSLPPPQTPFNPVVPFILITAHKHYVTLVLTVTQEWSFFRLNVRWRGGEKLLISRLTLQRKRRDPVKHVSTASYCSPAEYLMHDNKPKSNLCTAISGRNSTEQFMWHNCINWPYKTRLHFISM